MTRETMSPERNRQLAMLRVLLLKELRELCESIARRRAYDRERLAQAKRGAW